MKNDKFLEAIELIVPWLIFLAILFGLFMYANLMLKGIIELSEPISKIIP